LFLSRANSFLEAFSYFSDIEKICLNNFPFLGGILSSFGSSFSRREENSSPGSRKKNAMLHASALLEEG